MVNLQNLPNHYHNGGIWPFVGGLWVRFLCRLGQHQHGEEALERLALICREGIERDWEFNEWGHGLTGRPMGKAFQAWSAASYVAAYLCHQGDTQIEVDADLPDDVRLHKESGLPATIADSKVNLDQPSAHPDPNAPPPTTSEPPLDHL